jgi:hypothetical protein
VALGCGSVKIAAAMQRGFQSMDDKSAANVDRQADAVPAKKPYAAPALVRWGTLREMTLKVANTGGTDGGSFPKRRTR